MKTLSKDAWEQGKESQNHMKLNLARDRKGNKNGFYRFISRRMNIKEHVGLLLNVSEGTVTKDVGRARVFNIFFAFVNPTFLRLVIGGEVWSKIDLPSVEGDQFREYLNTLSVFKSEGLTSAEGACQHP